MPTSMPDSDLSGNTMASTFLTVIVPISTRSSMTTAALTMPLAVLTLASKDNDPVDTPSLRAVETKNHLEQIYLEKLGEEDYEKAKEVREWLVNHPMRGMLLAFLQAEDPYKV